MGLASLFFVYLVMRQNGHVFFEISSVRGPACAMNSGIRLPKHSSVTQMIMAGNVGYRTSHTSSSVSIDHFKLWKVGELKEFCSARGLPVSGKKKDELIALCYAAATTNLPLVLKKDRKEHRVSRLCLWEINYSSYTYYYIVSRYYTTRSTR